MTEKRFKLVDIGFVYDNDELIGMKEIVDLLNELDEKYVDEFSLRETLQQELQRVENENEKLHHAIVETEKMVQSTYDELTKLRCIKKNLGRIKTQWDWIMEAIQYD